MKFSKRRIEPKMTAKWFVVDVFAHTAAIILFGAGIHFAFEFGNVVPIIGSFFIIYFLFWLPDRIRKRHQRDDMNPH